MLRDSTGGQEWGETAEKYEISFWKDKKVLNLVLDDNSKTWKKALHCNF